MVVSSLGHLSHWLKTPLPYKFVGSHRWRRETGDVSYMATIIGGLRSHKCGFDLFEIQ